MFSKLLQIKNALNQKFLDREKEIEAMLVALLSRQHILLIGPAGTGKSALSMELAKIVNGSNYFQWLLTRFSTPEELFGPLSLKELEKGIYKRNTVAKMPEAQIVFLDEIFKANSAILNSLLTIINERLFYNNGTPIKTPLMTIIGSSNEYPEEGEGLEALFDRFLLRFEVDYIKNDSDFISMLKGQGQAQQMPSISLEELDKFQTYSDMVDIPEDVYMTLATIRKYLQDEGIRPSDRRFKQSLSLLQSKALLEQRQTVMIKDILLLQNSLWETADQADLVRQIVKENSQDKVTTEIERCLSESNEIFKANSAGDVQTDNLLEASRNLKAIQQNLLNIEKANPDRVDIKDAVNKIESYRKSLTELALNY